MRFLVLFSVFVFSLASFAEGVTKRQALRALDNAYNSVLESEEELDYQAIVSMAEEIASMTEGGALICSHQGGGWYHLVDRRAGKNLSGSTMELRVCESVLASAKKGLVCTHQGGGWFHLQDRRAGKQLTGSTLELRNCVASIEDSRNGLVCTHQGGGWYHLYDRIQQKNISGSTMPYGQCVRSIR